MTRDRRPLPLGFVQLERALSKLGVASRTEARAMIADGRVTVDGRLAHDPAEAVRPERQSIRVDGRRLMRPERVVVMLHKPKGTVTTLRDPEGRPTVYECIRDVPARVLAVGRLDWATTGLLLFTNDSRLAAWLTDPANAVPRLYAATVRGGLGDEAAARAALGLDVDGERLTARIRIRKRSARETHLEVELREGKNREVRRLLAALGHEVTALKRVSFGGLALGRLLPGTWRLVTTDEVRRLATALDDRESRRALPVSPKGPARRPSGSAAGPASKESAPRR